MPENTPDLNYWFVGAMFGGDGDQTPRFLKDGIWENGYTYRYLEKVKSVRPGDRIAIKAACVRKHGLEFKNRGHTVSMMKIKATGTVTENVGDGRHLKVDWDSPAPAREWYFFTARSTIWRVDPKDWLRQGLIDFTFKGTPQDLDRFRNHPFWRDRFGDGGRNDVRFAWSSFYEAISEKLLEHREDRSRLVAGINEMAQQFKLTYLTDHFPDGTQGPLRDVCPFTVMGIFNRNNTVDNRKVFAREVAKILGVEEEVPESFEGIPLLNNQRSWFHGWAKDRKDGDIDSLWKVFGAAQGLLDSDGAGVVQEFQAAYDAARNIHGVSWNLTMGLYWAHPWDFATLESATRIYLEGVGFQNHKAMSDRHTGADYLDLMEALEIRFDESEFPVHNYPELSLVAWKGESEPVPETGPVTPQIVAPEVVASYGIPEIVEEGCFLEPSHVETLLNRLKEKKNLILQGAPGTGKTWLAKRLGYALIGAKDPRFLRTIQFHPNYSYEDFVRGFRPSKGGVLDVVDGPFLKFVEQVSAKPNNNFVMVIEEINRGNPAQIFGELLTLLEATKRSITDAVELCYPDAEGNRTSLHLPPNLHVIGTMNIADRSLALVDLALRRRFAFATLETSLGAAWKNWLVSQCGLETDFVDLVRDRLRSLNNEIEKDRRLGKAFRIGHSYATPPGPVTDSVQWFQQVVETEIQPLLEEYWFDDPEKVDEAVKKLLERY